MDVIFEELGLDEAELDDKLEDNVRARVIDADLLIIILILSPILIGFLSDQHFEQSIDLIKLFAGAEEEAHDFHGGSVKLLVIFFSTWHAMVKKLIKATTLLPHFVVKVPLIGSPSLL